MQRQTAKLFLNGRSQAVRLPKEFRFEGTEVYIHRQGDQIILSPKRQEVFKNTPLPSDDFLSERVDLPLQEREDLF